MLTKCSAPECTKMVEVSSFTQFKNCMYSVIHGGNFASFNFCPEHKERITSGTFNDGDDKTNLDLNSRS